MQWLEEGDFTVLDTLWSGEEILQRIQPGQAKEEYLLELRAFADPAQAQAASAKDVEWQQWLTFCHHPSLLLPLHCRHQGNQAQVVYPAKAVTTSWPTYVSQVYKEYMADEDLTLELAFRLTLIYGALVGKGLRPVSLERPRPERILLTGEGDVRALPLRFASHDESGAQSILEGLANIMFAAFIHPAQGKREFLPRCRDVNREISLDAQTLVRRCLTGQPDLFDTPAALTRALTQLHIRRNAEAPYRDGGPLVAFRADAPDRDYVPQLEQAIEAQSAESTAPPTWMQAIWRLEFFQNIGNLRWLFVVFYLVTLAPLLLTRLPADALAFAVFVVSSIYWMCAIAIYHGYRRRNSR